MTMATTQKLSISLRVQDAKWIRGAARRRRTTVSALLGEAVHAYRQLEARREFLATLGDDERATDAEAEEIRREWRG